MAAQRDQEGFIAMLEGATLVSSYDAELPPQAKLAMDCPTTAQGTDDELLLDLSDEPSNGRSRRPAKDSAEWDNDAVPMKLEKIRAAFLNSKTAAEVTAAAGNMPVAMWLECVIKLMPKNVQVTGSVDFTHMLAGLAPIDRDAYRPKVVEAEYSVVGEVD